MAESVDVAGDNVDNVDDKKNNGNEPPVIAEEEIGKKCPKCGGVFKGFVRTGKLKYVPCPDPKYFFV